jgi:DNA-directed RNA polymerase specialized sigma24 family protein
VKAWLLTIFKNCHLTALKQQQRRGTVPLPDEHDALDEQALIATEPDPETATITRDQERTLERLVSALPDPYREAIIVREI